MNKEDLYNNILKNTDNEKYLNPKPIDNRTDYGRGIVYKGWDGKEFASMDEVMQYNEMFYKSMMINTEEKGMRR